MTTIVNRLSLIATIPVLIGLAACGKSNGTMDDGLKHDLAAAGGSSVELAPRMGQPQLVISAIEAGPTSAAVRRAVKPVAKPTTQSAPRMASKSDAAPERAAQPVAEQHAMEQHAPSASARAAEPAPLPPAAQRSAQRQSGTYKTEAEVFRQMPWIRP